MADVVRQASCVCGQVTCEAVGAPIFSGVCYCDDCQAGGRMIEALPDAQPVLTPDGGAAYLTCRDDRFRCTSGAELLQGCRLKEGAPTKRFVASCCQSAMYLKFGPGHWISAYRDRFQGDVPPLEARSQIKFRHAETPLPDDAPSYRSFPPKLLVRLLTSRLAMLIGR